MPLFSFFNRLKEVLKTKLFPAGLPTFSQARKIGRVLDWREKIQLVFFFLLFTASAFFLARGFYYRNTEIVAADGGEYIEGVIGQPRFLNPIYGALNDADRDLVQLLFSGLMDYDENGKLVPNLAKEYRISEDGKVIEVILEENLFWSDGKGFTADDVVFTIKTIQNPDYKSPLRANWVGVKAEKISDFVVRFALNSPYAAFLENLTLKILPQHIWQEIPAENFPFSPYNLSPVSLGPYQPKVINQDKQGHVNSITLAINPRYHGKKPYLEEITFLFFENEEELIKAGQRKEIHGLSLSAPQDYLELKKFGFNKYRFFLPRYFAIFFNPAKSPVLAETEVRQALNYAANKEKILKEALLGEGKIAQSPILPELYGFNAALVQYEFDPEKAKEILEKAGYVLKEDGFREKTIKEEIIFTFKSELKVGSQGTEVRQLQTCLNDPAIGGPEIYPDGKITGFFGNETKNAVIKFQEKYAKEILQPQGFKTGNGIVGKATRQKLNELCGKKPGKIIPLAFSLVTVDQPLLVSVAEVIKKQWQAVGVNVEIKIMDIETLEQETIKPRQYDALLFGEVLGALPDPFPFWHSSQKKDPGLNLAGFENKNADKLLEEARTNLEPAARKEKLEAFQNILLESAPALFLYTPDYVYLVDDKIKGVSGRIITDPSKRFSSVENWYLKTERNWR